MFLHSGSSMMTWAAPDFLVHGPCALNLPNAAQLSTKSILYASCFPSNLSCMRSSSRPNPDSVKPLTVSIEQRLKIERKRVVAARVSEVSEPSGHDQAGPNSVLEPRAKLVAKGSEEYVIEELQKPLAEYMTLPASQYSVLDAERIERVDNNTFRCYVHRFKFFAIEVCPVLLVRVEEQPDGCCIRLLSCTLEGSPIATAQNKKFSASMINRVSWSKSNKSPKARKLISDATIEVSLEIPLAFRVVPVEIIETGGNQVLGQVLRIMLPRFLDQLAKDYYAWASGDSSRRPLGTGEL
ncbi:hypothetical protein O6H91_01G031400 [Diphasiastrum complanatum]|uniref:Uncharacterized protein n=1 Tax=Diphasiastrum complanatum TaxID=34168 RepID=A0ACC2EPJ1_DIPCM|nr:hypothetical protein O6H91_01G031400 [Diphasiastrum complanatum]